jgi:hypothetical protein
MQKISDTFCPAKWNELNLNLNYNYAYGCCKSIPLEYQHNYSEILNPQKKNLLDGIFKQFTYFIEEFENRKNIKLPQDIKDILYAQH